MIRERWLKIDDIYHEALLRPADVRAAFLEAACAQDLELRREVESLLNQTEPRKTSSNLIRMGRQPGSLRAAKLAATRLFHSSEQVAWVMCTVLMTASLVVMLR